MGIESDAPVAGPPSPENPGDPFPATVLMVPALFTLRTRLFMLSAM